MAVRTRAQLKADADSYLPDNAGGDISPEDVRERVKDLADSVAIPAEPQNWTKPQRVEPATLASGTTITMNLADGNDRILTLGHNATISNPADIAGYVGQKGSIAGAQDGTGGRTLSMGNLWFPVGAATMPNIPTAANAKFRIDYHVVSSTRIDFSVSSVGV